MQHRRNAHRFAHFGQTRSAVNCSRFRRQQSLRSTGNGVAAGGQDNDVVFDQFFNQGDAFIVVLGAGIVASHDAGAASDATINDVVI